MKSKLLRTVSALGLAAALTASAGACGEKAPVQEPVKTISSESPEPVSEVKEAASEETEASETEPEEAAAEETFAAKLAGIYSCKNGEEDYTLELFEAGGNLYGYVDEGGYSYWALELVPRNPEELLDPDTKSLELGVLSFSNMSNLTEWWSSPELCILTAENGELKFSSMDGADQPITKNGAEVVFTPDEEAEGAFPYVNEADPKNTDPSLIGLWKENTEESTSWFWFNEDGTFQIYQKKPGTEVCFGKGNYKATEPGTCEVMFSRPESGGMPYELTLNYEAAQDTLDLAPTEDGWSGMDGWEDGEKRSLVKADEAEIPLVVLTKPDDPAALRADPRTISYDGKERVLTSQFLASSDIENNGKNFLRIGNMVYFRTAFPDENAMEFSGLWGYFLNNQELAEYGKVSFCDLETGETGTAFFCNAAGPLWYLDGRFYNTLNDGTLIRCWPDGSGQKDFVSTEYTSVRDASAENDYLAYYDYSNEMVMVTDGTIYGGSYTRGGEDTIAHLKFAGEDLFMEVYDHEIDGTVLVELKPDGTTIEYGVLPASHNYGWTTPELTQTERDGDKVYLAFAWFDGTMAILSDYAVVSLTEGDEGSLKVLVQDLPDGFEDGSDAPWFVIEDGESVRYTRHDPHGEAALSNRSYGDLVYYASPDQEEVVVPNLIPEYPLSQPDGAETKIFQAAERAGDSIFYCIADCERKFGEDIGWREGYVYRGMHFCRADLSTGETVELDLL